ncbi:MAG: subtilisin family serine protease [Porticoccaceae bacterium]|jgi:subtilisin family serine protease
MKKSRLDSGLLSMAARLNAGLRNAAPISLEQLGPKIRAEGAASEADLPEQDSSLITLKLMVTPEGSAQVRDWIGISGGELVSDGDSVIVATMDVLKIQELENLPGLLRAESPYKLEMRMEQARGVATGTDVAINKHALNGKNVVVGIIDSGVDWSHADFLDGAGDSRIERFILAQRGSNTTSNYSRYTNIDINSALSGSSVIPQGDPHGHGTHCAGIAAGGGAASSGVHSGVATGATLMAMRSSLYDDEIITGIREMFSAAGDRPAVINLSLGGHNGAHDGTSAIENVIARETGPGRIIVVAAGNEGSDDIHWSDNLVAGQSLVMDAQIDDSDFQFVDVWIPRGDDVDISLEVGVSEAVPIDGTYHSTSIGRVGGVARVDAVNGEKNVTLFLDNCVLGESVRLLMQANTVTQGEVHAWAGPKARNVFNGGVNNFTVGMPATEDSAITVASFVSRNRILPGMGANPSLTFNHLSPFSSRGPSRSGIQKPDIAAPGQYITSSLASNSEMSKHKRYAQRRNTAGDLISIQGTSMATPFVAGVIALMLEREPTLNPAEIKQRFRATATRDTITGRIWNQEFGVGRINVDALLDYRP